MKRLALLLPLLALAAVPCLAQDPATSAAPAAEPLVSRSYPVLPTIDMTASFDSAPPDDGNGDPFQINGPSVDVSAWLKGYAAARGVSWPEGSEVAYLPSIGRVLMRNTEANHAILRDILAEWSSDGTVVVGLRYLVSDTSSADPFAALPTVRDAEQPDDAPAVRARVVETNAFSPLLAAAQNIRVHDAVPQFTSWGRREWTAIVTHTWRVPTCSSTTVAWNIGTEAPDSNGLFRVSLKATLSGKPDSDAERTSARYEATASLTLGSADMLLLGPVPVANISTNAIAWFTMTVAPALHSDEDPFALDSHAESAEDESHAESAGPESHAESAEGAE